MSELAASVQAWIADEVDPAASAELHTLLAAAEHGDQPAAAELAERFSAPLTFGTAGLRGPMRAGPNGMNRAVVRRAAAGLAAWLAARGQGSGIVVIGYDGRHHSVEFAQDSAAILAAAGLDARLLPRALPTPVLAYSVRHLGAVAGVMVTASHNPAADNGYKVYAGDGAQIVPPADREIEAAIRAVGSTRAIALAPDAVTVSDDAVVEAYIADVAGLLEPGPRQVRLVHTAMHGVGTEVAARVFAAAGFDSWTSVAEQAEPDPDFPTVEFPNPEEPGAIDRAVALAQAGSAELVLANDPDADRCAVAVPLDPTRRTGPWRMLRGDEVGVLLADALLRQGVVGTYATSIVSSSMLRAMAEAAGVGYAETLTGFKWIARVPGLVFGYEEALGYSVAPSLVADKDGISAALRVAELAADLGQRGSSLLTRLEELAAHYGRYATDQISVRVDDLSTIAATMTRLRAEPPELLLGEAATVTDLLPAADVLRVQTPGARVVFRPSGTEPKLKAYLEVVLAEGSAELARTRLTELRAQIQAALSG